MDGRTDNDPIFVADKPMAEGKLPPIRRFKFIAPGYFKTMGNPLVASPGPISTRIGLLSWYRRILRGSIGVIRHRHSGSGPAKLAVHPGARLIGVVGDERDDGVNKTPAIVYWPMHARHGRGCRCDGASPRNLRSTFVFRGAANPRDRHPDGAGCYARSRPADVRVGGIVTGGHWRGIRPLRRFRSHALDGRAALRRESP